MFRYHSAQPLHTHAYLWAPILETLSEYPDKPRRVFELGCGNGAFSEHLTQHGYDVVGVDPSAEGIHFANNARPQLRLELGSASDNLHERYGRFPFVTSLEVIEHVYAPRPSAGAIFDLLEPGGVALISTPYHSYLKNLAIALTGKSDFHYNPLWDDGHIKFWSMKTLSTLLTEAGLRDIRYLRTGRIPPLAMSMIAVCRRP